VLCSLAVICCLLPGEKVGLSKLLLMIFGACFTSLRVSGVAAPWPCVFGYGRTCSAVQLHVGTNSAPARALVPWLITACFSGLPPHRYCLRLAASLRGSWQELLNVKNAEGLCRQLYSTSHGPWSPENSRPCLIDDHFGL